MLKRYYKGVNRLFLTCIERLDFTLSSQDLVFPFAMAAARPFVPRNMAWIAIAIERLHEIRVYVYVYVDV